MTLNLVRIADGAVVATYGDAPAFVDLPEFQPRDDEGKPVGDPAAARVEGRGMLVDGWVDPTGAYQLVVRPPDIVPAPTPTQVCAQITAFRDARVAAGFADTATGKTWPGDPLSIGKWDALGSSAGLAILMLGAQAPTFALIAGDNTIVTLSAADTFALLNGRVMPWVSASFLFARAMKNGVLAGNPPADITQGWP